MKLNRENFEIALAKRSMNRKELAVKMGVAESTLSMGLNGKSEFSPKTVGKIAIALGCQVEDIIQRKEG